jgi:hypothetical protein
MMKNEGLGDTTFDVVNRIRVYGASGIVYTADDLNSQATYGVIEGSPISDTSITTYAEAKKTGDAELVLYNAKKFQGTVTVFGFPDVNAGEKIWVSLPDQSIHNKYRILQITQEFGTEVDVGFQSTFLIEKPIKDLSMVLRDYKQATSGKDMSSVENPNQMKFSLYLPFDDTTNIETLNGTTLSNGKLILTSGSSTGTIESITTTVSNNVTEVELRYEGSNVDNCTFQASVDDGETWQTITRNTLATITNTGNLLKLKVTMNVTGSTRPEFDWISLLYKDE